MKAPWTPPPDSVEVESALEGIRVFAPSPDPERPPERETFPCPACGAVLSFDPARGALACEHCDYVGATSSRTVGRSADESEFHVEILSRERRGWGAQRLELGCEACGGTLTVPEGERSARCPFCTSNRVVSRSAAQELLRPRFLIPFSKRSDEAIARAREWLGRGWMHPRQLIQVASGARLTGIYLPFWTFDTRVTAAWAAEVAHTRVETYFDKGKLKTRTVTVWIPETGRASISIDDHLTCGSTRIDARLLSKILPFDLGGLVEYESDYLAGWRAQEYDLSLEPAWDRARVQMRERAKRVCQERISGSFRNFSMMADFAEESWRHVLLPVYVAAYRFGGKTYQILINGQTAAVAGHKPVAWAKVWGAFVAALAPGALLGLIGLAVIERGGGVGALLAGAALLVPGFMIGRRLLRRAQKIEAGE